MKRGLLVLIAILITILLTFVSIVIHELGHALAMIIYGGHITTFYVDINSGYVIGMIPANAVFVVFLMGGLMQGAFFTGLGDYVNRLFYLPALMAVAYGIGEAFCVANDILILIHVLIYIFGYFAIISIIEDWLL